MERVILFGVKIFKPKNSPSDISSSSFNASMEELKLLAQTAGAEVVSIETQSREKPDPAYFAGRGRLEELKSKAAELRATAIIFDNLLKPAQQKNIEELTKLKIIDRARLILDIFASRARSSEGKLQVELAQLNYFLPRITERFGKFEQQTGGIGTRGPGEKKLEVDKRRIKDRITRLKKEISALAHRREISRKKRQRTGIPLVAIAGYTNVGKSTLLNLLIKNKPAKTVYADDKLFATLDPSTRSIKLPSGRQVLLSDTVGFIRNLPHELIDAFKSTLEEISAADLVLLLIDISSENKDEEREIALKTINSINPELIQQNRILEVYNKTDLIPSSHLNILSKNNDKILISAKNATGIDKLLDEIEKKLPPPPAQGEKKHTSTSTAQIFIPYKHSGQFLTDIHNLSIIIKEDFTDEGIKLKIKATPPFIEKIKNQLKKIYP